MKKSTLMLAVAGLTFSAASLSHEHDNAAGMSSLQQKVKMAMTMDHRSEKDTKRDANRTPVEALAFFGLKQDMKVIEFAPGNGWYTKILAPVLKDKGQLHVASKSSWMKELDPLLKKDALSNVRKLPIELWWHKEERRYGLDNLDFGMKDADMLLNIREYHNFNAQDKIKLNKATFNALKPGGTYVIVDHTRRHNEVETKELKRREDPVEVIIEVQAAGFKLVKSSDMFYRAADKLTDEVGRDSVTGKTDRFTLVFKKPL
jgi:predicted methyltransferase